MFLSDTVLNRLELTHQKNSCLTNGLENENDGGIDVWHIRNRREIILTSCARMDTPVLKKVAQASCVTSCKYQNCGTGTCKHRGKRPVCVCSRCAKGGGEWPAIPSKGKGKGK